jgi:hypothetical protein
MYFIYYASRIKFNTISTSPRYAYAFFQLRPQWQAYSIIKPHSYIHNKRGQYFNIQTFTLDASRWAKTSTTLVAVMVLIRKLFNAPKETRALRDPFFLFLRKLIPIPLRLYWKQRRTRETSSSSLSLSHTHTRFFFSASHFYDLKFNIGSLQIILLYDQGDCAWNLTCIPCGDVMCTPVYAHTHSFNLLYRWVKYVYMRSPAL